MEKAAPKSKLFFFLQQSISRFLDMLEVNSTYQTLSIKMTHGNTGSQVYCADIQRE